MADLTEDTPEALRRDVEAVSRVDAVPTILKVICERTTMGYAAVARVTDHTWMARTVRDEVQFGLPAGAQLDRKTTLCFEFRAAREAIVINNFDEDPHSLPSGTSNFEANVTCGRPTKAKKAGVGTVENRKIALIKDGLLSSRRRPRVCGGLDLS